MQYYEMIAESFLNGQMSDAKNLFVVMPKGNKIDMLKAMTVGGWNSGLGDHKIKSLFDLV